MINKSGKVIMLGGCPRTGKTTLSVKLVKSGKGFSKISSDYLGGAGEFEFVKTLVENLIYDTKAYGISSIYDYCSYDFTPADIDKLPFKDKLNIYFFGFPDISAEEIRYYIKHYAAPADWISHVDNDYIESVSKRIYAHNIELQEQCKKYNYRFINTGVGEERHIVLNSLYDEIIVKCGD